MQNTKINIVVFLKKVFSLFNLKKIKNALQYI